MKANRLERRRRILAAARRLIAATGFEGLTMRCLAQAARVSVPTIYSHVGGKHALLGALLEDRIQRVSARVQDTDWNDWVDRAMGFCQQGVSVVLEAPEYSRELVHLFLVLPETRETRQLLDEHALAAITQIIDAGLLGGEVVDWADSIVIAEAQYSNFICHLLAWAEGHGDDERFRLAVEFSAATSLMSISSGGSASKLEGIARQASAQLVALRETKPAQATSSA